MEQLEMTKSTFHKELLSELYQRIMNDEEITENDIYFFLQNHFDVNKFQIIKKETGIYLKKVETGVEKEITVDVIKKWIERKKK